MNKVQIVKKNIKGMPGYDLTFTDRNVTVGEYLDAMNNFIENGAIARLWPADRSQCQGCDLCCHEPLPLTSIDVMNICKATDTDFTGVFRYLWVEVQGNCIDITLRRRNGENCTFLQPDGTCSIYPYRPFTCQAYICCQTSEKADLLRSQVVNLGMDELIRSSIQAFKTVGRSLPLNQSQQAAVRIGDWPKNCFTGKTNYYQLGLREVLASDFKRFLVS